MCASRLDVGLIVPNIDAYSGAVERMVRLVEHSESADIRYTALLPKGGVPNAELGRNLNRLTRAGLLDSQTLAANGARTGRFDAIEIPTEYWWGAWKRGRAAGLEGPYFYDFHLLPYVGTLDLLKSARVGGLKSMDLARLPFLLHEKYGEAFPSSVYETLACAASVRAFSNLQEGRILAISAAVAGNLRSLGYDDPVYVPACPNGIEPEVVRESSKTDESVVYDGIYVGRFHPQKGFLDLPLLTAHLKVALKRDVRIAVCGGADAPRHRARFDEAVRSLGVADNLDILGRIPKRDLYAAIRRSRALLYPSYVDGFPITVLESLSLGTPVVGYDTDALGLAWGTEKAVFRSPFGDPKALANLYAEIEGDRRLPDAARAAKAGSEVLLSRYTWANVVREQRVFYEGGTAEA